MGAFGMPTDLIRRPLHAVCLVDGHRYEAWVEWRPPKDPVSFGSDMPIPHYLGQRCGRCGARFPGATCRPARETVA